MRQPSSTFLSIHFGRHVHVYCSRQRYIYSKEGTVQCEWKEWGNARGRWEHSHARKECNGVVVGNQETNAKIRSDDGKGVLVNGGVVKDVQAYRKIERASFEWRDGSNLATS